ncbi:MAG: hypothetical protein GC204_21530 [Chloroflexi bacterium]|nr:hypothetical protein [Chloroflexota bacterium]
MRTNHVLNRSVALLMLVPLVVYGVRHLLSKALEATRGPFGTGWWMLLPLGALFALGWTAFTVILAIVASRRARHPAPALVLLVGSVLALILPLLPLPLPIFPEQEFFAAHQADFEQVVTLARQDQLECAPDGSDCTTAGRKLPAEYQSLSRFGYVEVDHDVYAGLTVRFQPLDSTYPVIYFETADSRNRWLSSICAPTARWTRQLEYHWFLCAEDWD